LDDVKNDVDAGDKLASSDAPTEVLVALVVSALPLSD